MLKTSKDNVSSPLGKPLQYSTIPHCEDFFHYVPVEFPLLQCFFLLHLREESGSIFPVTLLYLVEDYNLILP